MSASDPWELFRVVHLDSYDEKKLHRDPASPAPVGPWRLMLQGAYRPCTTKEQFLAELRDAPGAVAAVVHLTDLQEHFRPGELDTWFDADPDETRPQRLVLVYGGSMTGCGDYARLVGDQLPARHKAKRWVTVPWSHLAGPARPVAWLARFLDYPPGKIERLSREFVEWREDAVGYPLETGERAFIEHLSSDESRIDGPNSGLLDYHLQVHGLNSRENRCREERTRRQELCRYCDTIWLLEGVAQGLRWEVARKLLEDVRRQVEGLLRSGIPLDDRDNPGNREGWRKLSNRIREMIDEALEQSGNA